MRPKIKEWGLRGVFTPCLWVKWSCQGSVGYATAEQTATLWVLQGNRGRTEIISSSPRPPLWKGSAMSMSWTTGAFFDLRSFRRPGFWYLLGAESEAENLWCYGNVWKLRSNIWLMWSTYHTFTTLSIVLLPQVSLPRSLISFAFMSLCRSLFPVFSFLTLK